MDRVSYTIVMPGYPEFNLPEIVQPILEVFVLLKF